MSPQDALHSPVALFYGALAYGLLLVAGVTLGVLRRRGKRVEQAWQSYRGWLVMIPLTATAIFLGREVTVVFFTAVGLLGFREFARATRLSADGYLTAAASLGILAECVTALVPGCYDLFLTLPALVVAGLLAVPVLRDRTEGQLRALTLAAFGFFYFGWMFGHVALLANAEQAYAYLIYLLIAVEINDVAAFLCGKAFGRRLLRRNISPKKTWEGALGALAVSLVLPWALRFTFPHLRPADLLAVGAIVGVGGQLGDLAVSVLKRDLGVKDMGSAIPGHGGVLDRIDSLTYVAPLYFHYLRLRHELAPFA
jgi:phosphatidate cytidylyltransferase